MHADVGLLLRHATDWCGFGLRFRGLFASLCRHGQLAESSAALSAQFHEVKPTCTCTGSGCGVAVGSAVAVSNFVCRLTGVGGCWQLLSLQTCIVCAGVQGI